MLKWRDLTSRAGWFAKANTATAPTASSPRAATSSRLGFCARNILKYNIPAWAKCAFLYEVAAFVGSVIFHACGSAWVFIFRGYRGC